MTQQMELNLSHPVYLSASLVEVRRRAAGKPFVGARKYQTNREELLHLLTAGPCEFDALSHAFAEFRWYEVFRDLLRLQREGLVRYIGDDSWARAGT